ncbi:MAG: hypothetical protein J0M12_03920 [Deltaproteobacteria bacterium]|nr:hypothetical protein [Deltaproteobacteria bacterium]
MPLESASAAPVASALTATSPVNSERSHPAFLAGPHRISHRLSLALTEDLSPQLILRLPRTEYRICRDLLREHERNICEGIPQIRTELGIAHERVLRERTSRAVKALRSELGPVPDPFGKLPYLIFCVREFQEFLAGRKPEPPATTVSLALLEEGQLSPEVFLAPVEGRSMRLIRAHFEERKARLLRSTTGRELSVAEQRRLGAAESTLKRCEEILRNRAYGMSGASVARRLKIDVTYVNRVIEGRPPAVLDSFARASGKHRSEMLSSPRVASNDWAYVCGAYQAITDRPDAAGRIIFTHSDNSVLTALAARIRSIAPQASPVIRDQPLSRRSVEAKQECQVRSVALVREISRVTEHSSKIPWILLGTAEERLEYLRGYSAFAASYSAGAVTFSFAANRSFAVQLGALFDLCGMPPTLSFSTLASVVFRDCESLRALVKHNILPARQHGEAETQAARLANGRTSYDLETYEAIVSKYRGQSGVSYRALERTTGISAATLRNWLLGINRPHMADRREHIRADAKAFGVPDAGAVALLYRKCGLSAEDSVRIASCADFKQIESLVHEFHLVGAAPGQLSGLLKGRLRVPEL